MVCHVAVMLKHEMKLKQNSFNTVLKQFRFSQNNAQAVTGCDDRSVLFRLKQNCFKTGFKMFCFSFTSLCEQFDTSINTYMLWVRVVQLVRVVLGHPEDQSHQQRLALPVAQQVPIDTAIRRIRHLHIYSIVHNIRKTAREDYVIKQDKMCYIK